jgi:hypothetical protein
MSIFKLRYITFDESAISQVEFELRGTRVTFSIGDVLTLALPDGALFAGNVSFLEISDKLSLIRTNGMRWSDVDRLLTRFHGSASLSEFRQLRAATKQEVSQFASNEAKFLADHVKKQKLKV